jgi:hypothetical protein
MSAGKVSHCVFGAICGTAVACSLCLILEFFKRHRGFTHGLIWRVRSIMPLEVQDRACPWPSPRRKRMSFGRERKGSTRGESKFAQGGCSGALGDTFLEPSGAVSWSPRMYSSGVFEVEGMPRSSMLASAEECI